MAKCLPVATTGSPYSVERRHLSGGPWGPRQIPSPSHLQFKMCAHPGVGLSVYKPVSVSLFILRTCSWFPSVSVCLVGLHVCSCSSIPFQQGRQTEIVREREREREKGPAFSQPLPFPPSSFSTSLSGDLISRSSTPR